MTARILIHDVGHGQSVHAFSPIGQTIVVDLGCSDTFSPLKWLKKSSDRIDSLIVTHPHGDHIDEILSLEALPLKPKQLSRPKWLTREEVLAANQESMRTRVLAYLSLSDAYSQPIAEDERIGNPQVTGGLSVQTFFSSECGRSNINNHSGVVVFEYLGLKVVIPGDNEPPSWQVLLKKADFVKAISGAYVFLASHHGRESGYCADIFDVFQPYLCVISDGRVQDTDATSRYSHHAQGWQVHSRSGDPTRERKAVTTRSDGFVDIRIGRNDNTRAFLEVTCR